MRIRWACSRERPLLKWEVMPVARDAPNSCRQRSKFERSLSFAIHTDYAKILKVTTDENTVITNQELPACIATMPSTSSVLARRIEPTFSTNGSALSNHCERLRIIVASFLQCTCCALTGSESNPALIQVLEKPNRSHHLHPKSCADLTAWIRNRLSGPCGRRGIVGF